MSFQRSMAIVLSMFVLAIEAGVAHAQDASTTARQAASSMPCPSGDSSCGNGAPSASTKPLKRKHHKRDAGAQQENSQAGGNPNQKIEPAPPNDPQYDDPGPEQ